MIQPFESHAPQWTQRIQQATEEFCQKSFAETESSQSNLDRFIRSAASANPPIILPSFAQDSFQRACSENLLEDEFLEEGEEASYDLDPKLGPSVRVPLGRNKLIPLPPQFVNNDSSFERQDPQNVHTKFENIDSTLISIAGNLYQLREVVDYWLPKDNDQNSNNTNSKGSRLDLARSRWPPSLLVEQLRIRLVHELNFIQICFTDHLQVTSNSICELREGTFGGRLNTKSIASAKQLFEKLKDLRRVVLKLGRPASDRSSSFKSLSNWIEERCMTEFLRVQEPYQPERFDPNDPTQAHIGQVFQQHLSSLLQSLNFISKAVQHLSKIFEIVECITKTMIEGLHKIMYDVHLGQTTGEFIASWASRWERVIFGLLFKVLGLPAIGNGLQRNFPGMEVEFVYLH